MYQVIKFYSNGKRRVIARGLTRDEAIAYCKRPNTSGITKGVRWFYGFDKE